MAGQEGDEAFTGLPGCLLDYCVIPTVQGTGAAGTWCMSPHLLQGYTTSGMRLLESLWYSLVVLALDKVADRC